MIKIKDVLDIELRDDNTKNGGVAFLGETVADFIDNEDVVLNKEDSVSELNKMLVEYGIEKIKPMTKKEFNKKYYIEVTVLAYQRMSLEENGSDEDEMFEYESMNALENTGYMVMDNESHDVLFEYDMGGETGFFEELKQEFNIVDI